MKNVPNESKLVYAINNFIVASWHLLFSYVSHLNTKTNLKMTFFSVRLTFGSMGIAMFSFKTTTVIILIFYCILIFSICFSSL